MPDGPKRNLEFKARLVDPKPAIAKARALGADLWGDLRQTDTYFVVDRGRLKLRETAGFQAELIFYSRDEQSAGRASDYEVAHSADGEALRSVLRKALGVRAVVRKRRTLLTLDTTRIHIDDVEGLGWFLEIEVPVKDADDATANQRIDALIRDLGFSWDDCIRASYLDLVLGE
jgi:predicted adenylyl cyclase CyaB